jgi:hypothetical protein
MIRPGHEPSEFERKMGLTQPCRHCGFGWGYHRSGDQLCPGTHEDGTLWSMSWHVSPGTRYEPGTRKEAP